MNWAVQFIVTPSGERLAVLPEDEYLLLLAASEDDEGDLKPEFLEELRRRGQTVAAGAPVVAFDALRGKSGSKRAKRDREHEGGMTRRRRAPR